MFPWFSERHWHSQLFCLRHWGEIDQFIKGDIVGCFDNINHKGLLEAFQKNLIDDRFHKLIQTFLITDIRDKEGKSYAAVDNFIDSGKLFVSCVDEYLPS